MEDFEIRHDKENHQFIAIVDGHESRIKYEEMPDGKTLNYRSTFVPPELRGQQIAGKITKFALEYAREHGYKIIPTCSYVERYIQLHEEYQDLVAD